MTQPTFSLIGEELKEDARMQEPVLTHYLSFTALRKSFKAYREHLASLRSYPIAPGSKWEKTTGLEFGVHFTVVDGVAIPLFPGLVEKFEAIEEKERGFDIIPAQSQGEVTGVNQASLKYSRERFPMGESTKGIHHRTTAEYGFLAGAEWQRSQHPDPDALAVEVIEFLFEKVANGEMVIMDGGELFLAKKGWIYWEESDGEMPLTASRLVQIFKQQKEANK